MATIKQNQEQLKKLSDLLVQLNAIKPEDLARENELGSSGSFTKGIPYFKRTLSLFRDLSEAHLDTVSYSKLQSLTSAAQEAVSQFAAIQSFSLEANPQNPTGIRDGLISQVGESYDKHFDQISPILAYSVRKGTDFKALEERARGTAAELDKVLEGQKKAASTQLAEINSTLEKVRRAAEEAGVAQHAIYFRQEAEEHQTSAGNWLKATSALAAVTVVIGIGAVVTYYLWLPELTPAQSIQLAIAKLAVFSVLFSGLLAGGRIYRAHRHNYVINKHRQNALSTFETFVKAANDDPTKNAVLLQATQCIFSPQITGYVHQEQESGGPMTMLEVMGGMLASQSKK